MKIILVTLFTLIGTALMALPNEKEKIVEAKISHQANLKTHNGCWDVNHFVFCKGDSAANEKPNFGYLFESGLQWVYVPIDTLPNLGLQDVAIEWRGQYIGVYGDNRHFAIVNGPMIYSYTTIPLANLLPNCQLKDSMPTPVDYVKSFLVYDSLYCIVTLAQGG